MAQPGVASRQPGAMPLAAALKGTSRSFYLSLRFLPAATRTQVALAYLLARAADTMADSPAAPVAVRQAGLEALRSALERGHAPAAVDPALRAAAPPGPARALLDGLPELFAALAELAPEERALVRGVLATLTGGMLDDLRQFPDPATVTALASAADLDAYTYAVAGCVGEFWTRLHARALPALAGAPVEELCARGVRLGQGLQLVNVLRDLPRDLAAGRCYLPRTELAAAGLAPADLREPVRSWPRVRPIVGRWIERALGHFAAGREYVLALPPGERRLRLCTWWPLALGLQTLAMLRRSPNLLEPGRVEKVRRGAVYRLLLSSFLRGASDAYVQSAFDRWSAAAAHAEPIVELPAP